MYKALTCMESPPAMKQLCKNILSPLALFTMFYMPQAHALDPFIGQIIWVGYNFCPRGFTEADGQLLPISQYSALFSLYGTNYGGDGRTTFALPDLRGRAAIHTGNGPGLPFRDLGDTFGSTDVTEVPAHTHGLAGGAVATLRANGATDSLNDNIAAPEGNYLADGQRAAIYSPEPDNVKADITEMHPDSIQLSGTTNIAGSNSVDNHQPSIVIRACVALEGIYPSRN